MSSEYGTNFLFPEVPDVCKSAPGFTSYSHPETVLLLHTSGTSGNKKLVPYSLDMVIVGKTQGKRNYRKSDVDSDTENEEL